MATCNTCCEKNYQANLEIYIGPMYSGKSTNVLTDLSFFHGVGLRCLYINFFGDNRSERREGENFSSHNSTLDNFHPRFETVLAKQLSDINVHDYHVIGIDECHFYKDLIKVVRTWLGEKKIIRCAGLSGDTQMNPIGDTLLLIPMADKVTFIPAKCQDCLDEDKIRGFNIAPFTRRLIDSKEQILIGGKNIYSPCCRYHHNKHQKKEERNSD